MALSVVRDWRLTLLGRSLLLISGELLANAICWVVAGLLFARHAETRGLLSLALLAWTIGLRHALDADHISAIDNATRGLIGMGQLPVTCGLFFSLGHSTIVIAVNVAIAISVSVYNNIGGVGDVGGVVGTAVSASFLFLIGVANSVILVNIVRNRRRRRRIEKRRDEGEADVQGLSAEEAELARKGERSLMMRVLGPVTTFVNRPWKMYPVGVLFGFGFDTASSIALIAISMLAKRDSAGGTIGQGDVVILPFLFTAGMSLIDSADSVLMLYAYAGAPDRTRALFERRKLRSGQVEAAETVMNNAAAAEELVPEYSKMQSQDAKENLDAMEMRGGVEADIEEVKGDVTASDAPHAEANANDVQNASVPPEHDAAEAAVRTKQHTMSDLSILLTLVSILVAFSISLIEIMGLIGDECGACQRAANDPDGGGLAGSWWRGWARANDDSGFIGAAIVGGFVILLAGWYGSRWVLRRVKEREVLSKPA